MTDVHTFTIDEAHAIQSKDAWRTAPEWVIDLWKARVTNLLALDSGNKVKKVVLMDILLHGDHLRLLLYSQEGQHSILSKQSFIVANLFTMMCKIIHMDFTHDLSNLYLG